jgi:hypothetical protein
MKAEFNLKSNPFRLTPAVSANEIIWAGFPIVKEQFETRISRSITIPNSSLILNWGDYGSGKTHAARYFNRQDVLQDLATKKGKVKPFSTSIVLPKGRNPVIDIYTVIIDKLDISSLRTEFSPILAQINAHIDTISDSSLIKSVLKAFFTNEVDANLLKKYLYGNIGADFKKLTSVDILRKLENDSDYIKLLAGIFSCLTYNKIKYSSVILWIDEFEDIAILSNVNIQKTNNFLRELLDNSPNNLLLFLNLTQSALLDVEDLGQYIGEAVKSRIKDRIEFKAPTQSDFLVFLKDLLAAHRTNTTETDLFKPFDNELTVKHILSNLDNKTLRGFSEAFSLILELADSDDKYPITTQYFEDNKKEIIGWKN